MFSALTTHNLNIYLEQCEKNCSHVFELKKNGLLDVCEHVTLNMYMCAWWLME